jgi:hypothetical protein
LFAFPGVGEQGASGFGKRSACGDNLEHAGKLHPIEQVQSLDRRLRAQHLEKQLIVAWGV